MSNWKTIVRNPKNLGAINLRGGGIAKRGTGVALKGGGRAALRFGSGRTNLLEELGRVEGEHSNRNRRDEIARVHSELNRGYAKGGRAGFKHGERVERKKKFEKSNKIGAPKGSRYDPETGKFFYPKPAAERPSKKFEKEKVTVDPTKMGKDESNYRSKYRDWNKAHQKTFGGKRIPKKGPVIRERQNPPSPTVRAPEAQGGRIGLKKGTDKNWIQKATASIKRRKTKGKCTPITKKGCTGRAKALAKTFKKMAAKRKA